MTSDTTDKIIEELLHSDTDKLIDYLVNNRDAFNKFIYTPLENAIKELNERQLNKKIKDSVGDLALPSIFCNQKKCAVVFRQVSTPNYEIRRFVSIVDALGKDFMPIFFEYFEDKFTDNNEWKHSLGKMSFYAGKGKKGGLKIERLNVIDFNQCKGKKFSEIQTVWNQQITKFHRELMNITYPHLSPDNFFDASGWFSGHGGNAKDYYLYFLKIFVKDAVLFENFMLDEKEADFTKYIFLPAFIGVMKKIGYKPLIVALEPTEIEGDVFWMCHPHESMEYVKNKIELL